MRVDGIKERFVALEAADAAALCRLASLRHQRALALAHAAKLRSTSAETAKVPQVYASPPLFFWRGCTLPAPLLLGKQYRGTLPPPYRGSVTERGGAAGIRFPLFFFLFFSVLFFGAGARFLLLHC